jgi:hypothetical protein
LANGDHSVTFYAQFFDGTVSGIWHLTIIVDPSYKNPVPLMISPINYTTYNTEEVPLVVWIETQTEIRYVACRDTVYFNVNTDTISEPATPSPSPEPTPTSPEGSPYSIPAIVAIGLVIPIAVGLGVLLYFKKRKR